MKSLMIGNMSIPLEKVTIPRLLEEGLIIETETCYKLGTSVDYELIEDFLSENTIEAD